MKPVIKPMNEGDNVREMVERIGWMSPVHYEILGFFDTHDIWISAFPLAMNIDYDGSYVTNQLEKLRQAGLVEKQGRAYRLTDRGRAFLAGDLDADDLPEPDGG